MAISTDNRGSSNLPLGMRNNNPGNLRPSGVVPWLGSAGTSNNFVVFSNIGYGLRAMALDLTNKITKDNLNTITKIITKYAPPVENNTAQYISSVSAYTGFDPNETIDYNESNLLALMRAQINVEQGTQASGLISNQDIKDGIALMPATIFTNFKDFFVDNPEIAAVSGFSLVAVVAILLLIFFRKSLTKIKIL